MIVDSRATTGPLDLIASATSALMSIGDLKQVCFFTRSDDSVNVPESKYGVYERTNGNLFWPYTYRSIDLLYLRTCIRFTKRCMLLKCFVYIAMKNACLY